MNDWGKLAVPLLILAFWGLRQIFERESPPANRGPAPGPGPGGPRPIDNLAARDRARDPSLRWSGPPPGRTSTGPTVRGQAASDDEIIIIRSDSILPQNSLPGRQGQGRRPQRPKSNAPGRVNEPIRPAPLGGQISQTVGQLIGQQQGLGPVDQKASLHSSARSQVSASPTPSPTSDALARALRSPERLREAFLLNELLQPPLALRGRKGR